MKRLSVKLDGENISLESLAEVLKKTSCLLADIETEITGHDHVARWDVTALEVGSAFVEVEPHFESAIPNESFVINRIVDGFIAAFDSTKENAESFNFSSKINNGFSALKSLVNKDVPKLIYTSKDQENETESEAEVTFDPQRSIPQVTVVSEGQSHTYFGSVEGILETLVGRETYCNIWDRISGKKIKCYCTKADLAELAAKGFEKNVVLTGEIREGSDGNIKSLRVLKFRILTPDSEIPKPSELLGLYVREASGS